QMAQAQDITERLKAQDQFAWVGAMNNIRNAAEEIALAELVYR
ncbi:MAG: TnpV protein, partial [Christensenellaceae bacterium]